MGFLLVSLILFVSGLLVLVATAKWTRQYLSGLGIHISLSRLFHQLHGPALAIPILGPLWVMSDSWDLIREIR